MEAYLEFNARIAPMLALNPEDLEHELVDTVVTEEGRVNLGKERMGVELQYLDGDTRLIVLNFNRKKPRYN